MGLAAALRDSFLRIDPRTLGLFRIALGLVLLLDLRYRAAVLEVFFSNQGLFPNHTLLWAPPASHQFSVFFSLSSPGEVAVGMAVCAVVFVGFTLGYRTGMLQVLTAICQASLNMRLVPLENGGNVVLTLLCTFSLLLPLGRRFSIDAVRRSMTHRAEQTPAELADRTAMVPPSQPIVSLAVLLLMLQLGMIYLFNVLQKGGPTWIEGTAVHYTLHQDRHVTPLGVWLRNHGPVALLQTATWGTLVIEAFGAAAVLSPVWSVRLRLLAVAALPALHLGFALCLNLGTFSHVMAVFCLLMLQPEHWEEVAARFRRWLPKRVVYFDVDCGICLALARLAARLDGLGRIELRGNDGPLPAGVAAGRAEQTLIVQDVASGRLYHRSAAVAATLAALPWGWLPAVVLRLPGLSWVFDALYDGVAQHRAGISRWLGLGVCGIAPASESRPLGEAPPPPSPAGRLAKRGAWALRELTAVGLIVACGLTLLNTNSTVPRWLRIPEVPALRAVVDGLRLYQGWRMFAPNAPRKDCALSVEAVTADGRVIDPYNQVASRLSGPLESIPPALGTDQFFASYSVFMPTDGFKAYRPALQQWLLQYHTRTGRPEDRIVRFVVYKLEDDSPVPGKTEPTGLTKTAFMRYPEPAH